MSDHRLDSRVLENVRLAAGCGAAPAMLLVVALATARPASVAEGLTLLARLSERIQELHVATPCPHQRLAELEPELQSEPELARMRLDVGDHELRGRLLFGELLGQKSFLQVAALAIAGVELSAADAELLGHEGVLTQLADVRIWPLAVTRRVSAGGGSLVEAVTAGLATLCTSQMAVTPVAGFMRFLAALEHDIGRGAALEPLLRERLASGERVLGIGRPVFGVDERVPPKLALAERYGRASGRSMLLAREIDRVVCDLKGLHVNSAGYQGALLRDLGFSPEPAAAFCLLYFMVPVLAHAVF